MAGVMAWSSTWIPDARIYAITLHEDGFLFKGQYRRPRFIRWSSITRVVASTLSEGGPDEWAITLHIRSADGRAWVPDRLMPFWGIVERLKQLDGFDHDAWKSAHVLEDGLIREVIPKRTVIYRASPS